MLKIIRLKERVREIIKLLGEQKIAPSVRSLLLEVVSAFEEAQHKRAMALKHKETALAIANKRRAQARALDAALRTILELYEDDSITPHPAADSCMLDRAFDDAADALLAVNGRSRAPEGFYGELPPSVDPERIQEFTIRLAELPPDVIGATVNGCYFSRADYDKNFRGD